MQHKIAKLLSILTIVLIAFESIGLAVMATPSTGDDAVTLHTRESHTSAFVAILSENTPEKEEKGESERKLLVGCELADLTQITIFLSQVHSPHVHFVPFEQQYNIRPSLLTLHCVLVI